MTSENHVPLKPIKWNFFVAVWGLIFGSSVRWYNKLRRGTEQLEKMTYGAVKSKGMKMHFIVNLLLLLAVLTGALIDMFSVGGGLSSFSSGILLAFYIHMFIMNRSIAKKLEQIAKDAGISVTVTKGGCCVWGDSLFAIILMALLIYCLPFVQQYKTIKLYNEIVNEINEE